MKSDLQKEINRIVDEIIALVESADGPVTLRKVEREIGGFAKQESPSWSCYRERRGVQAVYWTDMTQAGAEALNKVMFGHKVAVQPVSALPYLLEGGVIAHEDWQPVVLLPANAANLYTPQALFRVSQSSLPRLQTKPGWRPLTPGSVRSAADDYAL
jgi:hypothetical protein